MDSVRSGPFGQIFRPDNFVFGKFALGCVFWLKKFDSWIINQISLYMYVSLALVLEVNFLRRILFPQDKVVLVITGLRDITLREQNWSIQFSMWFEKKPRVATACKDFSSHTRSVAARVPVWAHYSSRRSVKNTQTVSWTRSALFHRQKYRIPSSNLTTLLCRFISSLKTRMRHTALTTRPCTISASEHSSSPLRHTATWTISFQQPWVESQLACDSLVR